MIRVIMLIIGVVYLLYAIWYYVEMKKIWKW